MLLKYFIAFVYTFVITVREHVSGETHVVSGEDVEHGKRPFQVSLQEFGGHFCGGSIIHKYYILTATHCTIDKSPSSITVVVGTTDLRNPYRSYNASKIINHANYNQNMSYRNDISLIRVSTPIMFTDIVQPIALPNYGEKVNQGASVVVSGWGKLYGPDSVGPEILQQARVFVMDHERCRQIYKKVNIPLFPTNICANDHDHRRGHCMGDSGGPLTAAYDGKLVGIVSWSVLDPDCGSPKYPGVYTRVSEYIYWIQKNMK